MTPSDSPGPKIEE